MDYRRQDNGFLSFLEHWQLFIVILVALAVSQVADFFASLKGTSWIWCYGVSLFLSIIGIALIAYAKLPLYRRHRFLTFGTKALPENRRDFYRWGYRLAFFAAAVFSALSRSRQ